MPCIPSKPKSQTLAPHKPQQRTDSPTTEYTKLITTTKPTLKPEKETTHCLPHQPIISDQHFMSSPSSLLLHEPYSEYPAQLP